MKTLSLCCGVHKSIYIIYPLGATLFMAAGVGTAGNISTIYTYLHISTHAGCRLVRLYTLYLYRHYCLLGNIFTLKWFNKQQHNVVQFSDRFSVEMSCSLLLETNSTSPYPWAGTFDVQNAGSNYNHNTLSPTENHKYAFVSSASGACN